MCQLRQNETGISGHPARALRLGCSFVNARRGQAGYGHGLVSSWVITGKRRSDRNRDICKNLIIKEIWPAGRIRICDLCLRRAALYPAELRAVYAIPAG